MLSTITLESWGYGIAVFAIIMIVFMLCSAIAKYVDKQSTKLAERIQGNRSEVIREKGLFDSFVDKLNFQLKEAEMKIDAKALILIVIAAAVLLYLLAYYTTGNFLVPISLLPFPLYFVPVIIIDMKRSKVMSRFNQELILVLRRMSAITKNDSVLNALTEVKDYPAYSLKMRFILNKIFSLFNYGSSIEDAFAEVAKDIPSKDFKRVSIAINVNKTLGSDLSESLQKIATEISDDTTKKKKAKSLMASTAISGKFLSIAPYVLIGYMFICSDFFDEYFLKFSNQLIFTGLLCFMGFGVYYINNLLREKEY